MIDNSPTDTECREALLAWGRAHRAVVERRFERRRRMCNAEHVSAAADAERAAEERCRLIASKLARAADDPPIGAKP